MSFANRDQINYWNDEAGPRWVAELETIDRLVAPLSDLLLQRAEVQPGDSVLDVGCGTGQTTLALAKQVGGSGWVSGVDVSLPMLEAARQRALGEGATINFILGDAQTTGLGGSAWDLCFSRFGVMFFDDPAAAFANLRSALKPTGRLVFLCWQAPQHNPWVTVPFQAAAPHLDPPPPEPGAPGPFALADESRIREVLADAGFGDAEIEPCHCQLDLGGGVDAALRVLQRIGPCSGLLEKASEDTRAAALFDMRVALSPHLQEGRVALDAAAWIVTASPARAERTST